MEEVIELLLKKQETLEADREAEKKLACSQIDAAYDERKDKISSLLDMAGYVPVVEEVEEVAEEVAEVVDEPEAEEAETVSAEPVENKPIAY